MCAREPRGISTRTELYHSWLGTHTKPRSSSKYFTGG
ncbi:unnamed protein product [Ranitomeya imitator]|uniref:Uncharacterized protein n=1 Tax=Ranitomeya imitator TaxID=111125 RepID=A0ABN9MGA8_9NEOB|nr:unnamed protein product [Ranitomeya imitator]